VVGSGDSTERTTWAISLTGSFGSAVSERAGKRKKVNSCVIHCSKRRPCGQSCRNAEAPRISAEKGKRSRAEVRYLLVPMEASRIIAL